MKIEPTLSNLQAELEQTIAILKETSLDPRNSVPSEPLTSLLAQCQSACVEIKSRSRLRMVHHFACTGGTLISKCIACLPNTILVSEIDPLSPLAAANTNQKPPFAPTDLIGGIISNTREVSDHTLIEIFRSSVLTALSALADQGLRLVLRDHPHSHFCSKTDIDTRPTVREMLANDIEVLSVVTVRHPLDSFLSLNHNNWIHFLPASLDEYCRRYHLFLDRHTGHPIVKYEDFQTDPPLTLEKICSYLALDYSDLAFDTFWVIKMSGDSGRRSRGIGARERREIPDSINQELHECQNYQTLCARLSYNPFDG